MTGWKKGFIDNIEKDSSEIHVYYIKHNQFESHKHNSHCSRLFIKLLISAIYIKISPVNS